MPKVRMLESKTGSEDGVAVKVFEKDETYNLSDSLARVFVNELKVGVLLIVKKAKKPGPSKTTVGGPSKRTASNKGSGKAAGKKAAPAKKSSSKRAVKKAATTKK